MRDIYLWHADIALSLLEQTPSKRQALTAEGFEVGQFAQSNSATGAIARMAVRFGTGDDALAGVVRARQDAVEQWQRLDKILIAAVSQTPDKRDLSKESRLQADLRGLDRQIAELDQKLTREFPNYAELVKPWPLPLADAQDLLAEDEAIIAYAVGEKDRTLLWVVLGAQVKVTCPTTPDHTLSSGWAMTDHRTTMIART